MASYRKRGKTWEYTISRARLGLTPLVKGGFRTKKDAEIEALEIEQKTKRGFIVDPLKDTFADYFKEWMDLYKKGHVEDITYSNYVQTWQSIKDYMPDTLVTEINKSSYQRVLNEYAKTHAKLTTKGFNTRVRASIQPLIEDGKIQSDFTKRAVVKGNGNDKEEKDKFVDYDDYKKIVQYFRNHLNPSFSSPTMLFIISITGLRASEAYGLTWDDIDFNNRIIKFHRTWNYRTKEGGFKKPKTESSVRDIIIDKASCELLKDFKSQQKELFEQMGVKNENNLICYHPTSGIITLSAVQNTLDFALKKLNISTPLTIHGLRHTHASVLLYLGVDILAVSKRLGHASVAITQQTYIHIVKELQAREDDKIESILSEL